MTIDERTATEAAVVAARTNDGWKIVNTLWAPT